jgi:subtilisin family serine protease
MRRVSVIGSALLTMACNDLTDTTVPPVARSVVELPVSLEPFANRVKDVPAVAFEQPQNTPGLEENPQVLAERIREARGEAFVGLKAAQSLRWSSSGERAGISKAEVVDGLSFLASLGVEVIDYFEHVGIAHVRVEPELVAAVSGSPLVDYIEPTGESYALAAVPRSVVASPFAQTTPWGLTKIGATTAWQKTSGGSVRVMIIDTGHDQGHEDLPSVPSQNCDGDFGGCTDAVGHGTHVLGVLTARSNGLGMVGIAKGVSPSNVYVYGACGAVVCDDDEIVAGINQAITWNIDVLSMSLSGGHSTALQNVVSQASAADIVMVAAAGNHCHGSFYCPQNGVVYPAAYGQVLGVSGTHTDDTFAHHNGLPDDCIVDWPDEPAYSVSNRGAHVDVSAPFHSLSTIPNDGYETRCGTSQATPLVAGVAAMIRAIQPSLADYEVRQRIFDTVIDLGASGWDQDFGYGRVSAYNAVGPWAAISGPIEVPPGQTCEWSGNGSGGVGSLDLGSIRACVGEGRGHHSGRGWRYGSCRGWRSHERWT